MSEEVPRHKTKQGKQDTDGRPILTDEDEQERQEEEAAEKPVDPE